MPKYTFKCKSCEKSIQKYTLSSCYDLPCICNSTMERQMPKLSGVKNTETVDKLTNKKHIENHNEILKERKADYYWEVVVPEMVSSGTYTIETMLEQNWVYYNEKKELVTRTKPPQKS